MTHEILTADKLTTPEGRALYRHFSAELLRLEHRIAFQNKIAAQSFLKSQEQTRIDEMMDSHG